MGGFKKELDESIRYNAADEESTASALRDTAKEHEKAGNYRQASVYYKAAAKAEDRAKVWRKLL
ncbi:hypothetical protein [Pseudonocardia spinosispora]|uniref:hypothetical protein n=1 Tax=Pseudonocardia spinosispora TaxID=103441 RepID=UPI0003FD6781|nr:hypothetical protein [Pseudonocardia spinosispora]